MAINTQRLLDSKAIRFATSVDSLTLQKVFLEALYRTVIDINQFTGMEITLPNSVEEDVDMDEKYYAAVSCGIDFHMQDTNLFSANPIIDAEVRFRNAMKAAQRMYYSGIDMNARFGTLPAGDADSEEL
jgi:hypothetical protein